MLTQTAEYALRAVLHIAAEQDGRLVRVDEVAERLDVPRNYLSKVMHALARRGILRSTRGPHGGFALGRLASEISLAEVIEPFDPIEDRCLLMRRPCSDANPCVAHHSWKVVAVQLRRFFRETTVDDIVANRASADVVLSPTEAMRSGSPGGTGRAGPGRGKRSG